MEILASNFRRRKIQMRNLKRTLSLLLTAAMLIGMMVVGLVL